MKSRIAQSWEEKPMANREKGREWETHNLKKCRFSIALSSVAFIVIQTRIFISEAAHQESHETNQLEIYVCRVSNKSGSFTIWTLLDRRAQSFNFLSINVNSCVSFRTMNSMHWLNNVLCCSWAERNEWIALLLVKSLGARSIGWRTLL